MNPALIAIIAELLLKYGPTVVDGFLTLLNKPAATVEDVQKWIADVKALDFDTLAGIKPPPTPPVA